MIPSSRQLISNLNAGLSKHYPFSFLGTCFLIGAVAFSYIITFRNHSNSQGCLSPSFFGFQVSTTMYHNIEYSDKPCFWSYEIVDESFLYHISAGLCIHFQLFYLRAPHSIVLEIRKNFISFQTHRFKCICFFHQFPY